MSDRATLNPVHENTPSVRADAPLRVLDLSTRAYNSLRRAGYDTVADIDSLSDERILDIRNVGVGTLDEIKEKLANYLDEQPLPEQPITSGASVEPLSPSDVSSSDRRILLLDNASISVLGLTTRVYNALRRAGVDTVGQLARMSSEQMQGVTNIGEKSLAEIEEKLDAYEADYASQTTKSVGPISSTSSVDFALQRCADRAPLDEIPLERLGLPQAWQHELLAAGVTSVGGLARQTSRAFTEHPLLRERLERYLSWLTEQESGAWEKEAAGRGISPLHKMELAETSLDDLMERWLSSSKYMDDRDRCVIRWRYGLHGEKLTLEEVGDRLEVTRERVRQLEKTALRHLNMPSSRTIIRPLTALMLHSLEQAHGLMREDEIADVLREHLRVDNLDPVAVAHLVLEFVPGMRCAGAGVWRLDDLPVEGTAAVRERLAKILEEERVPLPVKKVIDRFKATDFYRNHETELDDGLILAFLRVDPEICINDKQCGLRKWERHRLDEMILALRQIGEPAHYTKIAEETNALLESEMQTSAHNILAHMYRLPGIFVRVGHGIYGLAEWDLQHDGSLANAAHRVLSAAGKPLHYDVIANRVLKTWKARRSSVHVALNTDDRFVRIGPGVYWLREKIVENDEIEEADLGDLFGERLQELQEGVNREERSPGYDTHAEADAIRQIGTDFFS
jgi:hypothetical protein